MLKIVLFVLAIGFVALLAVIATKPADFTIERSAQVNAPPGVVFGLINDFHRWALWSPYEKLDPTMKKTFEGSASGPGAIYGWDGNSKAGAGRSTILDIKPNELVHIKLEMLRPFAATNDVNFILTPTPAGTRVTWVMKGHNNFMAKAACTFINIDKLVGTDFEAGLANMDKVASVQH